MPILGNSFWFFTAYFIMYLFSPFLNLILNNATKKQLSILFIGLVVFTFYASRNLGFSEVASLNYGYSILWFIILYLIGGFLRLYPPKIKKVYIFLIYILSTILLWAMTFIDTNGQLIHIIYYNTLDYNSPLVLIASICLLLLFKDIKIKNNILHKTICFVSSCTFGIYLLQESAIKPFIYYTLFDISKYYGRVDSVLIVLAFALALVLLGIAVEIIFKTIAFIFRKIFSSIIKKYNNKTLNE